MTSPCIAELIPRFEPPVRVGREASRAAVAARAEAEMRSADEAAMACLMRRAGVTPERRAALRREDRDRWEAIASGRSRGLYVHGPVGTGKTWLAMGVVAAAVSCGRSARIATEARLLGEVKDSFGDGEDHRALLRRLRECDLLAVDDMGKEPPTDWALATLFDVIDARWSAGLPTIVTSQLDRAQLAARMSERGGGQTARAIVSRLSVLDAVRTSGPDRRLA